MKPPGLEVIVELSKEVERVQSTLNSIGCITTLILNDTIPMYTTTILLTITPM